MISELIGNSCGADSRFYRCILRRRFMMILKAIVITRYKIAGSGMVTSLTSSLFFFEGWLAYSVLVGLFWKLQDESLVGEETLKV